jgi:peptidoglycan/xylan/chitin deacetylase (PgdA/CDA1 family)
MYHHVSPSPGMITVTVEHFEDQLRWLSSHGYRSLSSSEFAGHLAGQPVPKKSVLITFDDGYLDNWVYAYPLLKKYGFSAMLFLVTSWSKDGPPRSFMGQENLPETPDHRECEARARDGRSDEIAIRWSEARIMQEEGVFEIHSHTHTHTRWDKLDPEQKNTHMAEELTQARATLAANLGGVSDHHCWPQGYYDPEYILAFCGTQYHWQLGRAAHTGSGAPCDRACFQPLQALEAPPPERAMTRMAWPGQIARRKRAAVPLCL